MFDRYDEINKDSASKEQSIAWHMLAKIRILNVVIQWLDTFYPDFYVSSKMVSNHMSSVKFNRTNRTNCLYGISYMINKCSFVSQEIVEQIQKVKCRNIARFSN